MINGQVFTILWLYSIFIVWHDQSKEDTEDERMCSSEMELGNPYDTLHITNDFLFMTSVSGE